MSVSFPYPPIFSLFHLRSYPPITSSTFPSVQYLIPSSTLSLHFLLPPHYFAAIPLLYSSFIPLLFLFYPSLISLLFLFNFYLFFSFLFQPIVYPSLTQPSQDRTLSPHSSPQTPESPQIAVILLPIRALKTPSRPQLLMRLR